MWCFSPRGDRSLTNSPFGKERAPKLEGAEPDLRGLLDQ
jgi:hypothetical protein